MCGKLMRACAVGCAVFFASGVALAGDLTELNKTARAIYGKGRSALLTASDPVLIVVGDELVLRSGGQRVSEGFTPPLYHRLKELAHLPLGIFGALVPVATDAVKDDGTWRNDLVALEAAAVAAQTEVSALPATPATRAAAQKLLDTCVTFTRTRRMANSATDWATLTSFSTSVAPLVLAMSTEAANVQIDSLHAVVERWRANLGPEPWSKLHVLVLGPKTPRADHLVYQYFVAALGTGSGETRVIYTESVYDEQAALAQLGVLLIDRKVGAAFFGDAGRMETGPACRCRQGEAPEPVWQARRKLAWRTASCRQIGQAP